MKPITVLFLSLLSIQTALGSVIINNNQPGRVLTTLIRHDISYWNGSQWVPTTPAYFQEVTTYGESAEYNDHQTAGETCQFTTVWQDDDLDLDTFNKVGLTGSVDISISPGETAAVPVTTGSSQFLQVLTSSGGVFGSSQTQWKITLPGGSISITTGSVIDLVSIAAGAEYGSFQLQIGIGGDFTIPISITFFIPKIQYQNSHMSGSTWKTAAPTSPSGMKIGEESGMPLAFRVKPNPVVDAMPSSAFSWTGSSASSSGTGKTKSGVVFTGDNFHYQQLKVHGGIVEGATISTFEYPFWVLSELAYFTIHPEAAAWAEEIQDRSFDWANDQWTSVPDNGVENSTVHAYASGLWEIYFDEGVSEAVMTAHEYAPVNPNTYDPSDPGFSNNQLMDLTNNEIGRIACTGSGMSESALGNAIMYLVNLRLMTVMDDTANPQGSSLLRNN